ncbi:MAG: NYN domain-containing protein [Acidobacteriota bacterium]|nr:MAG: NYN domain-containing protein [Acidobacteriota bacterium]
MIALQEAESRATAAAQEAILQELGEQRAELSDNGQGEPASRNRGKDGDGETRVGVFVDVQNMFYGARGKQGRLDFAALLAAATSGRRLVRAVAYLVEAPEIDQRAFIHLLQMKAYEVKRKPLRIRADKTMKGNWDLEMALDALTTAEHVDVVVLVTGDGDFLPLVRQLKLRGKRVEIYGFPRSTAPDLRQAADRFYGITRRLLRPLEPTKNARRNTSLKTGSRSAATSGSATEKSSESATSDAPASSS